jgi:tetratricopeptide (TPR) repeat protein
VPSVVSVTVAEYHDFDDHRAVVRRELAPGARVDRFEIVRLLGTGGMGAVYEARDPELGRSVALKVIREPDPQLSIRLLREAQALAQLQHPNVVAVHDVGSDGDEVFVAMELVDGTSLDKHAPPASWREVVDLFVQVGRGLVAAHDKGLVHRDIKPSNLFVGRDGRVRVGDFGLARRQRDDGPANIRIDDEVVPVDAASAATIDLTTGKPPPETPASGLLSTPLTHHGNVVGTPKYMAPEQAAGRRATAASDQYSFCVALKELLPAGAPGWLTRAVERGLEQDPAKRHPSMQALVEILDQTPGRRRRRALVLAALVGTAGIATAFLVVAGRGDDSASFLPECDGGAEKIAAVWNDARRAEVEAAFAATGVVYANDAFSRVVAQLDRRRDQWVAMYSNACQATHLFRTQSPEMLERRMACLEDRRAEIDAFATELATIAKSAVDDADTVAPSVGDVSPCADVSALEELQPAPTEPEARRRYDELRREVISLRSRQRLRRFDKLTEDAAKVAEQAEAEGWKRIAARARYLEGNAHGHAGRAQEARTALESAATLAAAAGDDELEVEAWTMLVTMLVDAGELDDAKVLMIAADAAVRRAGDPASGRVQLMQAEAWIQAMSGEMRPARDTMARALELSDRATPDDVIQVLGNLASIEAQLEEFEPAIAHRRRSLEMSIERYGELSPPAAQALSDLGQTLQDSGDAVGGKAVLLEALDTLEKVFGADSPKVADTLQSLANASVDDLAAAEGYYVRAVAIHEKKKTLGLGRAMIGLAQTRIERGDKEGAREVLERVFPIIEERNGTESMEYAVAESAYGMAVGCAAKERLDHAIEVLTAQLGPEHGLTTDAVATRKACNQ